MGNARVDHRYDHLFFNAALEGLIDFICFERTGEHPSYAGLEMVNEAEERARLVLANLGVWCEQAGVNSRSEA